MTIAQIIVLEQGLELSFSFEDMLKYHGGASPGGVAHAYKADEELRLTAMKADMAARLMSVAAQGVYDAALVR